VTDPDTPDFSGLEGGEEEQAMRPGMGEFLTPFRRLLAEALTDAAGRYAAAPPR
jgi:hypothetical protein